MSWPCPKCGAECKTAESYGIHVGRCRAMSVEEILEIVKQTWDKPVKKELIPMAVASAIYTVHIARLRGKKV